MKIIQVGLGGMGNAWLNAVFNSPEVEYAGFVEINDTIAASQAERYHLDSTLIFHSLDEALNAISADGVLDITPPQFHKEVSLTALDTGVPVLSEKPLANTLDAARDIVRRADETGILHMVAQNYRYSVPAQTLKHVIMSGEMGRIAAVSVEFFKGPQFGGFRDEMPYPLIIDMAIHHFDMMRFFMDSDPVSVFGRSWNPPWSWYKGDASASVMLEFANGAAASYTGSWCSTGVETPWNAHWRFECENGVILLRDDQVYSHVRSNTLLDRGGYRQFENEELKLVSPVDMEYTAQAYLLHEFCEAVTNGTSPATTCQDNIRSLGIVFDAVRSFETSAVIHSGE
jgi:predicted dehydrogenase